MKWARGWRILACWLLLASLGGRGPLYAEEPEAEPARLKISGYGFWGNRDLKRTLQLLQPEGKAPEFFDANFIEDAAMILLSRLIRDGYLEPALTVTLTLADGTQVKHSWDKDLETLLPRPLEAKQARFRLRPGVLYYYDQIEFTGLEHLKEREALHFFIEADSLVQLKRNRIYTPAALDRSIGNLVEALERKGFEQARAEIAHLERNDETGAIKLQIAVEAGRRSTVRSLQLEIYTPDRAAEPKRSQVETNAVYSRHWQQDVIQNLRARAYREGYPDTTVEVSVLQRDTAGAGDQLDLLGRVVTGPHIILDDVLFEGNERTSDHVLNRRVRLKEGENLNRIEVERGRQRLARLGIFESISLRYEAAEPGRRVVVYELDEGKRIDFSLLFGYGSYEMLRGGFELEQFNLFGRAHSARLRATQSFKSSTGEYLYTMPELVGEQMDVFVNLTGLRREEISFTREEYGGGVGVQRHFPTIKSDVGLRYNYSFLNTVETDIGEIEALRRVRVAAWTLDLRHDERDNPLAPGSGYKVFSTFEVASAALGGQVDYQRLEAAASWHLNLGGGRLLHLGTSHGAIATLGGNRDEVPLNRRFFPGGEGSVRGFQSGEAAPRDAEGDVIGAESYIQGNLELEQRLTRAWSLVIFLDTVGFSERLADYPAREFLFSTGGGVRWKTIIGPARLEYGHNLNPRSGDPAGTIHFSLGFPF